MKLRILSISLVAPVILAQTTASWAHHACNPEKPYPALHSTRAQAPERVKQLNEVISEFLNKNYNTDSKKSRITVKSALLDQGRVVDAEASIQIEVRSTDSSAQVQVERLAYTIPEKECSHPEVSLALHSRFDLGSALTAEKFDTLSRMAPELLAAYLSDSLKEKFFYSVPVASRWIRPSVPSDVESPLEEIEFELEGAPDLSKLPASITREIVSLVSFKVHATLSLHELKVSVLIQLSPTGLMYKSAQGGASTYIDKLLSRDPQTLEELVSYLRSAEDAASKVIQGLKSLDE